MAFGLGILRLTPDAFWTLSIPELLAIVNAARRDMARGEPMARNDLASLLARYPDRSPRKEDHLHG